MSDTEKLMTAAECVRTLRQAGVIKFKQAYFAQLVGKGVIPFRTKEGSPKKWYLLSEVAEALRGWDDPGRNSQQTSDEKQRRQLEKVLMERKKYLLERIGAAQRPLDASMFETEEDIGLDILELNAQNLIVSEIAESFVEDLGKRLHMDLAGTLTEVAILEIFAEWMVDADDFAVSAGTATKASV